MQKYLCKKIPLPNYLTINYEMILVNNMYQKTYSYYSIHQICQMVVIFDSWVHI